jgi:hypothetical protein
MQNKTIELLSLTILFVSSARAFGICCAPPATTSGPIASGR